VCALRESALGRLWYMDFLPPLFRLDRIAVEGIDDGIAATLLTGVTRGQEYDYFRSMSSPSRLPSNAAP
jgi:hypothetical protein